MGDCANRRCDTANAVARRFAGKEQQMPGLKRLMLACGAVVALGLCLWIGINYAFTEQLPWQSSDGAAAVILHQAAAAGLPTHGSTLPQRTAEPAKPMAGAPPTPALAQPLT